MPQCSSWVHGVTAQRAGLEPPGKNQGEGFVNPDLLGHNATEPTSSNPGAPYCAKRFQGKAGSTASFYFAIPTVTVVLGARVNLQRVFVMYDFDPGAEIDQVLAFDGPNQIHQARVSRVVDGPGFDGVPDPTQDLEEGVNVFSVLHTPLVYWGICLVVSVRFTKDATVRFTGAGADFDAR